MSSPPLGPVGFLVALVLLGPSSCGVSSTRKPRTIVFAASSLTAPFQALEDAFEERHPGSEIAVHFAGTPQLVVQACAGAAVDVFAAADQPSMQRVVGAGLVVEAPRVFARNRLTIAVEKGNPKRIEGLGDLAREDLKVALCGPEVPAGRYARQVLGQAGVAVSSVSDEPSVRAIVSKLELGELDAGIVYTTDVRDPGRQVDAVAIPAELNVVAAYPIAVLSAGTSRGTGKSFVRFVSSDEGQRILQSFGFVVP